MKKLILFSLIAIWTVVVVYSCSKTSVKETKTSVEKTKQTSSIVKRETSNFDHYFTDEEMAYLNENFGEFDLSTVATTTVNDKTITTICSIGNDDYNFKRLVITEKSSNGVTQAIKDIFTITSTNKTIAEAQNDGDTLGERLKINIVCLNIGTKFDIDKDSKLNETQLGFNVQNAQRFASCFKSCWAQHVMDIIHNGGALIMCGIATAECAAAISAECGWSCLFN